MYYFFKTKAMVHGILFVRVQNTFACLKFCVTLFGKNMDYYKGKIYNNAPSMHKQIIQLPFNTII